MKSNSPSPSPKTVIVPAAPKVALFPPRDQTLQILTRILADGQSLDDALEEWGDRLDARGRAWVWDVAQTIFRYRGGLDALIDQHALKKKPTGRTRKQLWIATAQLVFHSDVSAEKVVHETVEWVKRDSGAPSAGFVNALLRKVADSRAEWAEILEGEFPGMLPDRWTAELRKRHPAEWVKAFARASLAQPTTWFRIRESVAAKKEINAAQFAAGPIPESYAWKGEPTLLTECARRKDYLVQDLASQTLIAENLAEVKKRLVESRGVGLVRVLDRCAAPGGKAIGLAWSGAETFAYDSNERRRVSLGHAVREKAAAVHLLESEADFPTGIEWIWVDAPCTGSGTVRRHPEMKWLKEAKDLASLVAIQTDLVKDSWARLPSGGFLTYTVCSVFPSEGPELLKKLGLDEHRVREWTLAPHLEPSTDGFYGALIRKP